MPRLEFSVLHSGITDEKGVKFSYQAENKIFTCEPPHLTLVYCRIQNLEYRFDSDTKKAEISLTPSTSICYTVIEAADFVNDEESDVKVIVENETFLLHKLFLCKASPIFNAMLTSDFKEKETLTINLPGKKANLFVDFLNAFYFVRLKNLLDFSKENSYLRARYLYPLFDEYQMSELLKICVENMMNASLYTSLKLGESTPDVIVTELLNQAHLAERYGENELLDKVIEHIAKISSKLWKSHYLFQKLPSDLQNMFMVRKIDSLEFKIESLEAEVTRLRRGRDNINMAPALFRF